MKFSDKVVYQIYPKSFNDSNNDGIGDINGIIEKLDYLKLLGIDYLWLTPIFTSPQNDNGYDIEDYYSIDPQFGTMKDLENLISEAKKRKIGILFDMVFNHTSTQHTWFKKALLGEQKYKDYYFFKKAKEGKEPTNWESKFGGSCWEYIEKFDEYYLHLFDKTQADLNWDNPNVRKELIKVLNFWLEKGIKGFRFDVINLIDKVNFEDDYDGIGKKFYTDGEKVKEYLKEMNKNSFGMYKNIITVGEMSATSINHCAEYSNNNGTELSMTFNFHHLKVDYKNKEKWTTMPFDFIELKKLFDLWGVEMEQKGGWNALFWNCHDQPRSVSRFGNDQKYREQSAKMLATVIHLQRGTPFIYQGEEIGMTNNYFTSINQYRDVESINHYHIMKEKGIPEKQILQILQTKSRDNARSPMQWTKTNGFSKSTPWLEMNSNCNIINVENAIYDKDSIFYYYQKLITLRKKYTVISKGSYIPFLQKNKDIYAFKRTHGKDEIMVITNFYERTCKVEIEDSNTYDVLLSNYQRNYITKTIVLQPYEALVLIKTT